jgi:DNA-binding transcriptional ArsR family regulator
LSRRAAAERNGIAEIEVADRLFAALAHPARRQILLAVHVRGACRAGEIARRFDCSWPTTSRHLAILVAGGLLDVERLGRERVYRANARLLRDMLERWCGYFEEPAVES